MKTSRETRHDHQREKTDMRLYRLGKLGSLYAPSALGGPSDGVLAENIVLSEEGLVRIPSHMSFEQAATLPCAAVTAWNAALVKGALQAGHTVVTLGTGGVSLFTLQLALMTG